MSPELKAELDQRLVAAAFPSWEWEPGDVVEHSMWHEYGGGCGTCGYDQPGTELTVTVSRAYRPDGCFDLDLVRSSTFKSDELVDIWSAVMA